MESKGKVHFESRELGKGTQPTHLQAPPPYNESLLANSYMPISNILTQNRDFCILRRCSNPKILKK